MNWFTKSKMVLGSSVLLLLYFLSYFNQSLSLPSYYDNFCCIDDRKFNLFAVSIPLFIFTIIFIIFSEKNLTSWKKFTFIYLFIYLFIYFISPTHRVDYIWFQRETVSFFGSILYLIISLVLIFYKSFKKER